jgi:hypothetical protein
VFERDKRDCEVEEEEALQGCSANTTGTTLSFKFQQHLLPLPRCDAS